MSNKTAVEAADLLLRTIMACHQPFGGKVFVGLGDFRQVAPVVKSAAASATFDASIRSSPIWSTFHVLRLTAPIRNASDPEYSAWVDQIGDGFISGHNIRMPFIQQVSSKEEAIDYLYPPDILSNQSQLAARSFLPPLNINVDDFNTAVLERLPSAAG
jgi:hypothetical protein